MRTMKDRLFNTTQATELLNMNRWQVLHYITIKLLPAHKIGNGEAIKGSHKEWRIWEKDLIDFEKIVSQYRRNRTPKGMREIHEG